MINTTGHPDSWIGLDLHQEHGNLWIKVSDTTMGFKCACHLAFGRRYTRLMAAMDLGHGWP